MSESCFEIVLDVMAREIDMLRYQLKAAGEEKAKMRNHAIMVDNENAKLRNRVHALEEENAELCKHVVDCNDENAKLRAMIEARCEKHE